MQTWTYTETELATQALVDADQWERLRHELGDAMVEELANEYFAEIQETWFHASALPFSLEPKKFRSLAHRSAGAAGTLGLVRLRFAFLCLEHNEFGVASVQFFQHMQATFFQTRQWVQSQFSTPVE